MAAPTTKEIREAFSDYRAAWKDIRAEAQADMQAISVEGPWADADRAARKDAQRPCIHLDQTNQFLNQTIGNVRKSKRSVKVTPKGNGANDKDAENRSNLIMGIEERSQAQPTYLYAFECMIQRSYGFALLCTEYQNETSFDQEIVVKPVQNPDSILICPYYKKPDQSDLTDGFVLDRIPKSEFKQRWGKKALTDFSSEVMGEVGIADWVTDKMVQLAEYWKVESDYKTLLLVATPEGLVVITEKEHEEMGKKFEVKRDRRVEIPRVVQYMTNGIEILDEIAWAGSRIPIICCFGPERWTMEGGNAKRELLSMVRFARDPQMLFDYLATQECEEAGLVPKVPFVGAVGQFKTDEDAWENLTKIPRAYVQYDIIIDGVTGQAVPPPSRPQYQPNFDQYETAKDAAGRALQASMGISPLPDAAQRRNQKSGVALEKIDDMESLGSFQFIDRYENCFLHNMGWQINELITPILDTRRQMPMSQPDGKRSVVQIVGNTSHPIENGQYDTADLDEDHIHTGKGEFDVTISAGPSQDSERDEQMDFLNTLTDNLAQLPPPGTPQAKVFALAIRMRPTLGPIGAQIADVFDPPDPSNLPPAAQAAIQQIQSQLQQALTENAALHADRAGRVLEQQTKKEIEQMKAQNAVVLQHLKNLTDLIKAELGAKSRSTDQIAEQDASRLESVLGFAHDAASQTLDHVHDHQMADKTAQQAQDLASHQAELMPPPDSTETASTQTAGS